MWNGEGMSNGDWLWTLGWALVLVGFAGGALLGLGFHSEAFLGGYASLRRRLVRLGHIACVMLGVLSMLFALSPAGAREGDLARICRGLWCVGAITMPLVCFVTAWRLSWRYAFVVPVVALISAAGATLALL